MPLIGLGIHTLIALFFAVHAMRTGREMYWLFILFSFPLLGSLVYFLAIYLPHSRLERNIVKAGRQALRSLDPGKELREAQAAFDLTPTAQNQMRLAAALLAHGDSHSAAQHYAACLRGPFATDPEMRLGAAQALLEIGELDSAQALLGELRRDTPDFRPEAMALLLADIHARAGRPQEARQAYQDALDRFGTFEVRARFAIWAYRAEQQELGNLLMEQIRHDVRHWERHTRDYNRALLKQVESAARAPSA